MGSITYCIANELECLVRSENPIDVRMLDYWVFLDEQTETENSGVIQISKSI